MAAVWLWSACARIISGSVVNPLWSTVGFFGLAITKVRHLFKIMKCKEVLSIPAFDYDFPDNRVHVCCWKRIPDFRCTRGENWLLTCTPVKSEVNSPPPQYGVAYVWWCVKISHSRNRSPSKTTKLSMCISENSYLLYGTHDFHTQRTTFSTNSIIMLSANIKCLYLLRGINLIVPKF